MFGRLFRGVRRKSPGRRIYRGTPPQGASRPSGAEVPPVPLDRCHDLLVAFGIERRTVAYDRWVRTDPVSADDLRTVLHEDSPQLFGADWRAEVGDVLPYLAAALANLGVELSFEIDPHRPDLTGETGRFLHDGRTVPFRYVDCEETPWADLVRVVADLVGAGAEFRAESSNGENDSDGFAVLTPDRWLDAERAAPDLIADEFVPLPRGG